MKSDYWKNKWQVGDIGFHQKETEPLLVEYFSSLIPSRVLVPLCGKTLDMIWLKSKGWKVVGVELASLACEAFFSENGIRFATRNEMGFTVFEGEEITIWCGDLFELPQVAVTGVGAIYDRAALIALPPEMRLRYVERLSSLAAPSTQMLTLAIEYPQEQVQGPPFSVGAPEIRESYGKSWSAHEVYRAVDPSWSMRNKKFSNVQVVKTAHRMEKQ